MEKRAVRVVRAERRQVEWRSIDLDSMIPARHRARLLWEVVEGLDLSGFREKIKAVEGGKGRPATDPKILATLWLYATANGVGSARELDRLCREHRAYEWICGKVKMNYHTLSDFRVAHGHALEVLFTQVLGVLMHRGLLKVRRVSQDGLRVRASAGRGSFRRRGTLERCLEEAREQVEAVKKLADDASVPARVKAARARAARERHERVKAAIEAVKDLKTRRAKKRGGQSAKEEPRGSTTDAEAHKMRMADGGFRPAYNLQIAADTQSGFVVGVSVSCTGSDAGLAKPMVEQIEERTGVRPEEFLGDGGYTDLKTIDALDALGVTLYAPVASRKEDRDPYEPLERDSVPVRQWRGRMKEEKAKAIYKERAATSERVNADVRAHRTLDRLLVRGSAKVLCIALWNVLAFNLLRLIARM